MFDVFGTNSLSYHCLECDWILHAPIMIAQIHSQLVEGKEPAKLALLDCVYVKHPPPVSHNERALGDASWCFFLAQTAVKLGAFQTSTA